MLKQTKTKLIWTITSSGIDKLGLNAIAKTITHHHIDAIRATYSLESKQKLIDLRKNLEETQCSHPNQPSAGKVPFLLNFVSRKAILSVPNNELEAQDGSCLDIVLIVDPLFCSSLSCANSKSPHLELRISNVDQIKNLRPGSLLSFSYGAVEASITEIKEGHEKGSFLISVQIALGGILASGMEVHSTDISSDLFPLLPEVEKSLSDKEFSSLADYIIVEGVKSEKELQYIKKCILGENVKSSLRHPSVAITDKTLDKEATLPPRFLLKIDSKRNFELLPKLIPMVDGIFLSRSELGIDEHPHNLPILQKDLVDKCNQMSKIIIIASELMHSMRKNSNPTRAEVSDMANAAADGADALVLSHEITEGPFANLVAQVSKETLLNSEAWYKKKWKACSLSTIPSDDDAVTYGAIRVAEEANVRSIVCFTEGGYTAMKLSSMCTPIEIIAITCNKKIMRQLNLLRSVNCALLDTKLQMEKILQETKEILVKNFHYKKGEKFVFVSLTASSVAAKNSNLFTLQEID